jgi:hypothetical protein
LHNHTPPPPPPHGGWLEWGSWIGSDQLAGLPRGGSRRVMTAILLVLMPQGKVKIEKRYEFFLSFFRKLLTNIFVKNPKEDNFVDNFVTAKTGSTKCPI